MINMSAAAQSAITRSFTYHVRAESWLGDRLLADNIPIAGGTEDCDRALRVPERVVLTVPRNSRGTDLTPVATDSALAANGQRIKLEVGIGLAGSGEIEWLQRGWFVVYSSEPIGDAIQVDARGLLQLIDEARLVSPFQPTGTILATVQGLLEPTLTVVVSGVADRSVPADVNYDEDRLGALIELLDAWPADGQVTPEGYLSVNPIAENDTAVASFSDEDEGTIIQADGTSTRQGSWNVVVARGTAASGAQVQGVAYLERGPKIYGGPFNPQPVPYFFSSPLLTTVDQAADAARTVLARLSRRSVQMFTIEAVPHPGIQAGDVVSVTSSAYTGLAAVEAYSLPLTPNEGSMTLQVRAL